MLTSPSDERRCAAMFEAGKRLNNVMVQHGRAVLNALRADPAWDAARKLPRKTSREEAVRREAFKAVREAHGFTKAAFESAAIAHKNAARFNDRLGAHVTQKIAEKVFNAFEQHLYGARGAPRFKGLKRPLKSLEGKNNETMLRWDSDARFLVLNPKWGLEAKLPDLAKDEWLWSALQAPTKYCRILWRMVGDRRRYFVQLVQEGQAPMKASVLSRLAQPDTRGGLDIGPSTLAWCTDTDAGLIRFCAEVEQPQRLISRLSRQVDRQRRANNPEHFDEKGRFKRNPAPWTTSTRQRGVQARLRSAHDHAGECRANAHGRDINQLLSQARTWRHDGVSVKSLQKNYGRSVLTRAPGRFMSELQRKAERAGGASLAQNARELKTSQYCHVRQAFIKKSLSERWHGFPDGSAVQRDVYSAFLARNAVERVDADGVVGWAHDAQALAQAFARLLPALQARRLFKSSSEMQDENARASIARSARSQKSTNCKAAASAAAGRHARGAVRAETSSKPSV